MNLKAIALLAVPLLAVGTWLWWPASAPAPAPGVAAAAVVKAEPVAAVPVEELGLALAIERKCIVAEFSGNGREKLRLVVLNKGTAPLQLSIPLGQVFQSDLTSPVVVLQPMSMRIEPGRTRELEVRTAATRSTAKVAPANFEVSYTAVPKLEPLLRQLEMHPELTQGAVQTAVLALTENLPLSAVAKFTLAAGSLPSRFNTDSFRVDTFDLMGALVLLRDIGTREASLALTVDPQLKIESMIDPATRAIARRYYGIAAESEWEFWRRELLQGEPSTRHYALYGIARFYPDVALEMLPRWARETRTNPVYRLSAVQALADTQRPEALPILRALALELAGRPELATAATGAAEYLDYQLAQVGAARRAVAFRTAQQNGAELAARN
jgi:hypothetical protein